MCPCGPAVVAESANVDTISAMRIAVLVLDGVFDLGLASLLDAFALANAFTQSEARFSLVRTGVRKRVKTGQGLLVPLDPTPRRAPDLVIVPALGAKTPDTLESMLERPETRDLGALVRAWYAEGAQVAAACTGTFVLAGTEVLDGKAATTTWWLAPLFRARFPAVRLDEGQMIVEAPGCVTAGAALAHLDLALFVIRRVSPSLARTTARHLTFDQRASQGAYVLPDHLAHADPLVERFEAWARKHFVEFSLGAAARAVGVSDRTLERRVRGALGMSPLAFVQRLRVEAAMFQLETTDRSLDEIAERVGYRDGITLRTLLRRKTGRSVRELRHRG